VHGYQSYIWNQAVSERLRRFGRSVLVGDLVIKRENADLIEEVVLDEGVDEDQPPSDTGEDKRYLGAVIDVTEENLAEYAIEDVVMPMVGNQVRMPRNPELAQLYHELLLKDGITMDHFTKMASQDSMSASGAYRKIIAKPEDMVYDVVAMQNENENLLTADYLREADPTPEIIAESRVAVTKALRMRFNLKTSSYATMLIREVTRTSSAFSSQYQLSLDQKN